MKVDFHCHTKAIKKGESKDRNVSVEKFKNMVELAEVELLVITNHNHFDLNQFKKFSKAVQETCMIWPGIELDVFGKSGTPGHLVVICNPRQSEEFNSAIVELIGDTNVNDFSIDVSILIESLKELDLIYSPHHLKSKQLSFKDIKAIQLEISNENRLLWEPSGINGVGILNINGLKGILGSDGHSWDKYDKAQLGELRYKISSFENFCKALDKDLPVMNDLISRSFNKNIEVYGDFKKQKHSFEIPIYNDINIIYGDKGSGKSEILESLNSYFKVNWSSASFI